MALTPIVFFNTLINNDDVYTLTSLYITHKYAMNQTNTHNNNIIIIVVHIYADSKMPPGAYLLLRNTQGMAALRVRTCPVPWGMSAQEHTFTFRQIFLISGGNYTLVTCIR